MQCIIAKTITSPLKYTNFMSLEDNNRTTKFLGKIVFNLNTNP